MKSVLISIRPEWADKILTGEKTMEVRKTRPRLETPFKVYIYCTLAASKEFNLDDHNWDVSARNCGGWPAKRGRVIAEFTCDEIDCVDIPYPAYQDQLDEKYLRESCVPYYTLHRRFGHDDAYFWHISNLKVYDEPVSLSNFIPNCRHLEDEAGCRAYRERGLGCPDQRYDLNPDGSVNMAICRRRVKRPPQSWCYAEEADIADLL